MPELPDVVVYREALIRHVAGRPLERIRLSSPFVLRSYDPPLEVIFGRRVRDVLRVGKRLALAFDDELFLVIHLMISGRLRWRSASAPAALRRDKSTAEPAIAKKLLLATFELPHGSLFFTEASSKKRASLTLVRGDAALAALDPGGVEPLDATREQFYDALTRESHTLKRSLTDPHLFSGIGNAYSDEILHAAKLSPLKLSRTLSDHEFGRLYDATRVTLTAWTDRLREQTGEGFPEKVTAFHDEMAVHGKFRKPCPICGSLVQRIVYAENECNYCATCQTGGRLLADRSLSRLLKDDWPKSIDDV